MDEKTAQQHFEDSNQLSLDYVKAVRKELKDSAERLAREFGHTTGYSLFIMSRIAKFMGDD